MTIASLEDLQPAARAVVEGYLGEVDAVLRPLNPSIADETAEDLREHYLHTLEASASVAEVRATVAELGSPAEYADGVSAQSHAAADPTEPVGRILGVPYDYRLTPERLAARWWSPRDPRVLMPRAFGLGWDINFGALAVKLHLIEPDAEDEPFGSVSDRAFLVALLVPVALTAFLAGTYVGARSSLPATLPTHWNIAGAADGFWPKNAAFGLLIVLAGLPTLWAIWSVAMRGRPLVRGAIISFASFMSALAAGVWALTLATVIAPPVNASMPMLAILPGLLVPMAVLLGLARAGRAAEQQRDLHKAVSR